MGVISGPSPPCDFKQDIETLPEGRFVSSSAEEGVGRDPWQGGCGVEFHGKSFTPFLAHSVRGGTGLAGAMRGELFK